MVISSLYLFLGPRTVMAAKTSCKKWIYLLSIFIAIKLFQLTHFVKWRQTLLELYSWEPYSRSERGRESCSGLFTSFIKNESISYGKEIYKKVCCICRVVVLCVKPIFLDIEVGCHCCHQILRSLLCLSWEGGHETKWQFPVSPTNWAASSLSKEEIQQKINWTDIWHWHHEGFIFCQKWYRRVRDWKSCRRLPI